MNWKTKAEKLGIEIIEHLSENGNKIGWFNFKHPKGYLCLAQNGKFCVVDSVQDWCGNTNLNITDFDYFIENVEIFNYGSFENFKWRISDRIKSFEKDPKNNLYNKKWLEIVYLNDDKPGQILAYRNILINDYNKDHNTNYTWD